MPKWYWVGVFWFISCMNLIAIAYHRFYGLECLYVLNRVEAVCVKCWSSLHFNIQMVHFLIWKRHNCFTNEMFNVSISDWVLFVWPIEIRNDSQWLMLCNDLCHHAIKCLYFQILLGSHYVYARFLISAFAESPSHTSFSDR